MNAERVCVPDGSEYIRVKLTRRWPDPPSMWQNHGDSAFEQNGPETMDPRAGARAEMAEHNATSQRISDEILRKDLNS